MNLKSLLNTLDNIAKEKNLSQPYIVGGIPRDIFLEKTEELNDIDITTGNDDIHILAELFAKEMDASIQTLKDDNKKVIFGDITFDFSTNFKYKDIDKILENLNISNPTDLQKETFSRDFTINTLLITPSFKKVIDLTGKGIKDIKNKILSCPVDCSLSFENSPNRMLRAYLYKTKYNLKFDDNLQKAIKDNIHLFEKIHTRYASEILNKIVEYDENILNELIELGILKRLPLTKYIVKILLNKKQILDVI